MPTVLTYGLCPPIRWLRMEGSRMDTVRIFARTDFRPTSPVANPTSLPNRRGFKVSAQASSDRSDFTAARNAPDRQDAYATGGLCYAADAAQVLSLHLLAQTPTRRCAQTPIQFRGAFALNVSLRARPAASRAFLPDPPESRPASCA